MEDTLEVAKKYHEQRDPFLEWLDHSERTWSAIDPIGTETPVIEDQLAKQRDTVAGIQNHKQDLDDLILCGGDLLKFTSGRLLCGILTL